MARRINKKAKKKKGPASIPVSKQAHSLRVEALLVDVSSMIVDGDYAGAAELCERLLSYLPKGTLQRAEVLYFYGTAQGALENFQRAYDAYSEGLSIDPKNAELWYNRGMTSCFTSRFGRSLRDYEKAAALNKRPELAADIKKRLQESQELVEMSLAMRGPGFTLDQLIEQEDLFHKGLELMEQRKYAEAEAAFRRSIELGDCLPQPWGNIAGCYLLQGRYDEAEAAYKRALEIDPNYDLAKENLANMPTIRQEGMPEFEIREPFKGVGLKQSITFLPER